MNSCTGVVEGRQRGTPGEIYGRFSDREIYAAMLDGRVDLFTALASELAELLARHAIDCVVGDAAQGYNPAHDACPFVTDAAVAIAMQAHGRSIVTCDFSVTGRPDVAPGTGETMRASGAARRQLVEVSTPRAA